MSSSMAADPCLGIFLRVHRVYAFYEVIILVRAIFANTELGFSSLGLTRVVVVSLMFEKAKECWNPL
jgi:hypothetical protein